MTDNDFKFRILRRDLREQDVVYIDNELVEDAVAYLASCGMDVVVVDRGSFSAVSLTQTSGKAAVR